MNKLLLVGLMCLAACAAPVERPGVPPDAVELGRFREAVALAVDPAGRVYVVDAGAATVFVFGPDGLLFDTVGGAGAGDKAFVEPHDIDPTNGLVRVVADAGAGQVVRFDNEGAHLGTLVVNADEANRIGVEPAASANQADPYRRSAARPVAVAVGGAGEVFVIEATRGVVMKWDATRTLERVFGGPDAGDGALADPIDLAVTADAVYVADAGRNAVLAFDRYGAFRAQFADVPGVRAVNAAGRDVLVTTAAGAALYAPEGGVRWMVPWLGTEPLVQAVVGDAGLFWLTPSRLYRTPR